jgi:ketosteroid isomerase-like protein
MNFLIKLMFVVIAGLVSSISIAADDQALEKRVDDFRQALLNPTEAALKNLTSSDLTYGHSSGLMENQSEFIQKLVSGTSDFVTIDLQDQSIKMFGDVAVVRHRLIADINDGGKPNSIKIGVMLVWQKQSGEWKLIARQAFKFPV